MALKVGDQAPPFTATADDGSTSTLDQFRGRRVVLYFYTKADTAG